MSAITLVTFASSADAIPPTEVPLQFAKSATGASTPVDVSAHAVLRLDLDVRADQGSHPDVRLTFEHAPTSTGPWTTLIEKQFTWRDWPRAARVVLDAFDKFVRVRWVARATDHAPLNFQIGVGGVGLPDAA